MKFIVVWSDDTVDELHFAPSDRAEEILLLVRSSVDGGRPFGVDVTSPDYGEQVNANYLENLRRDAHPTFVEFADKIVRWDIDFDEQNEDGQCDDCGTIFGQCTCDLD